MSATASPPSRTPEDYSPDPEGHFVRRIRERKIPGYAIRKCIQNGSVETLEAGRVALIADGHTVVVNPRSMTAETVYRGSP